MRRSRRARRAARHEHLEAATHPARERVERSAHVDRLSVGEAVMHMDLTNAPVLMFHDKATGRVNVVYRRADGNVGWLDPGA